MQFIARDLAARADALSHGAVPGQARPSSHMGFPTSGWVAWRPLRLLVALLGWLIPFAFLAWAARLLFLEGYWYDALDNNFPGDFMLTATLHGQQWWTGQGIFYGPIFVFESVFLVQPGIMSAVDYARLNFLLFGVAFACVWLALFGAHRPRLAMLVLGAWLGYHMTVEAFSNGAHLELLQLALIAVALLLATRGHQVGAGASLGLAIATKTLPALFVPYLAIKRQWRMLGGVLLLAGVPFLAVCWVQRVTPWDGLYQLVYQGGNLTKLEFSEYEYTPRAEIARMLAGPGGKLTDAQAHLAIGAHFVIALAAIASGGWVLYRARVGAAQYGLMFGLVLAVMLLATPSAHAAYYVYLLPGLTAILAVLVGRPLTRLTVCLWIALVSAYVITGFDQPFFLIQRLFGFGLVVPEHWLVWHLPTLGLLLTLTSLAVLLLVRPVGQTRPALPPRAER